MDNILVVGHSFIKDSNRSVWTKLGHRNSYNVDLLIPKTWKVKGSKKIQTCDSRTIGLENIFAENSYFNGYENFYFFKLLKTFSILNSKKYKSIVINQECGSLSLFFLNIICHFTLNRKTEKYLIVSENLKRQALRWLVPFEKFNAVFIHKILGHSLESKELLEWKGIYTPWIYFPPFYSSDLISNKKVNSDNLTLGCLGHLSEEKSIVNLVGIFHTLRKDKKINMVLTGFSHLNTIKNQSDVKFIHVSSSLDIESFFSKIDVLIIPSSTDEHWDEDLTKAIIQSVACGSFVITSNRGYLLEIMNHLDLDYIFEEGSSKSLEKEILRFCMNHKQLDIKYHQGLNQSIFSENAFVDRFINIISE
jgi:glycosyltransferase involved in cell wall biosynthesis